jgi:hypothetical protein
MVTMRCTTIAWSNLLLRLAGGAGLILLPLCALACSQRSDPEESRETPQNAAAASSSSPTPLVPPPAPPYDLDADISLRTAFARFHVDASAPINVEGGIFVMVGDHPGRVYDDSVALAHQALAAYFNSRFSKRPEQAVTVYIFDAQKAYDAFCADRFHRRCDSPLGFYVRETREIVVNQGPGLPTLTHEIVHPLVEADFPKAPMWLNEGIAALFEKPVFPRPGEVLGDVNWRLPRLRAALASPTERDEARLDALFATSAATFREQGRDLPYAVARYACQWLDAEHHLWPFYQAWRDDVTNDPTGEKAFVRVVGQTPKDANAAWEKWVRGL